MRGLSKREAVALAIAVAPTVIFDEPDDETADAMLVERGLAYEIDGEDEECTWTEVWATDLGHLALRVHRAAQDCSDA